MSKDVPSGKLVRKICIIIHFYDASGSKSVMNNEFTDYHISCLEPSPVFNRRGKNKAVLPSIDFYESVKKFVADL